MNDSSELVYFFAPSFTSFLFNRIKGWQIFCAYAQTPESHLVAAWFRSENSLPLENFILLGIGCVAGILLITIIRRRKTKTAPIAAQDLAILLAQKRTNTGVDLASLSRLSPVLVVFLRHAGCTFCRQAVCDVAQAKRKLGEAGVRIVFVHFGNAEASEVLFRMNGIVSPETIYDDNQQLYRAFGLRRGTLSEVAGPGVIWRGIRAGLLEGHGIGRAEGDVLQLPGVFLLDNCKIARSFRHKSAADRPDYLDIALPQSTGSIE